MKILQITYSLTPGGAERLVLDLSNELSKNHEVVLLTILDDSVGENAFYKDELSSRVNYQCARLKRGFYLKKILTLYKIIRRINPDIVHFHGALIIHFFILSILFFRKPKYIETLHSRADALFSKKIPSIISKQFYNSRLVSLCTISDENKRFLESYSKINNSTLIYNGRLRPIPSDSLVEVKQQVNKMKIDDEDLVFIHIGRCVDVKNQNTLVRAFNKLFEDNTKAILIIVGPGFETTLGQYLSDIANKERIYFLGTKNNVIDYLLCSDGFCLSSWYEGMPITLIEALACGCVPVCTPVSGVVDLIDDGKTGFISEDFHVDHFYDSLVRFIKYRKRIVKSELINIYEKRLSIEMCTENYCKLYSRLLYQGLDEKVCSKDLESDDRTEYHKRIRILQVTYSLTSGGAERLVLDLSNELSSKHEIHLLTVLDDAMEHNSFYKYELDKKVIYHCAKQTRGFSVKKLFVLYNTIKKINPDVVHFHGVIISHFFILPIFLYRKPKYLETLHNKADIILTWRRLSFISKIFYKLNLVSLCTISDANKRSLENVSNINNSTLIYNGRKRPIPSPQHSAVRSEINKYKRSSNDLVFIHIGRCVAQKNQQMLITVFNKLAKNNLNFVLLIIGPGFESKLGVSLKRMADPNRIHVLDTKRNIVDYILCSDAFCLTSLYEGMPITLIEALACECTPIGTPVSGIIDLIIDGDTGFISNDFSENSYYEAVVRYIDKRTTINRSNLSRIYEEKLTIEKCAIQYEQVYRRLIR